MARLAASSMGFSKTQFLQDSAASSVWRHSCAQLHRSGNCQAVDTLSAVFAPQRLGRARNLSPAGLRRSVPFLMPSKMSSQRACVSAADSASSAASVEDEEAEIAEGTMDGSPEGLTRERVMQEVMQRLTEEDLEEAAHKYNIEEELFAEIDYAQINAFTDRPFSGNPAAVCYLPYEKDDAWLQLIAREFNLSETAFLVKRRSTRKEGKGNSFLEVDESGKRLKAVKKNMAPVENEFDLRWFTPIVEVDLCGHATIASAHLLFVSGIVEGDTALFHTRSGVLKATKVSGYEEDEEPPSEVEEKPLKKKRPAGKGVVEVDFPLVPAVACNDASLLSDALGGITVTWIGQSSLGDYLVEIPSNEDVESVKPQLDKMLDLSGRGGVIVTARAAEDSEFDFVSRFFCPKNGISEDPATGSAHCTLGPYWAAKLGKKELTAYQASKRGGKFLVRVDEGAGRAYIQGGAVLVMAGVLLNTMRS